MGWLSILPVFPLQLQVKEFPLELFFILFVISLYIIFISACFGKYFWTNLPVPVLTRPCNSDGSWKYDLSGL